MELFESELIECFCPKCGKLIQSSFDEVEALLNKKMVVCDHCKQMLEIPYGQRCPYCKIPFRKIDFQKKDLQEGGRKIKCPLCEESLWAPAGKDKNAPVIIIE